MEQHARATRQETVELGSALRQLPMPFAAKPIFLHLRQQLTTATNQIALYIVQTASGKKEKCYPFIVRPLAK